MGIEERLAALERRIAALERENLGLRQELDGGADVRADGDELTLREREEIQEMVRRGTEYMRQLADEDTRRRREERKKERAKAQRPAVKFNRKPVKAGKGARA